MTKSQFNIKISKDLLANVKRQAIRSGKSLTEHITDLLNKSLFEDDLQTPEFNHGNKFEEFEKRILSLESIVRNREYLSQKSKPFNNSEAINCTKFMRGCFDKEFEKGKFANKKMAFDDLFKTIQIYDQLTNSFSDRLQEIMLSDNAAPWTGNELNELTGNDKCNCSIRKGLIMWTGKIDCPSQQEICDKGEELLSLF
ncbi:hypothetical protein [Prochlorococcus marinus]|uniref:hypothetical protein n=1 Tax=Prochlorococcus marinus TaxID=1219 RepID=UPI0022B3BD37|nr:hypothetical protein [Prochlorococcus marinus]